MDRPDYAPPVWRQDAPQPLDLAKPDESRGMADRMVGLRGRSRRPGAGQPRVDLEHRRRSRRAAAHAVPSDHVSSQSRSRPETPLAAGRTRGFEASRTGPATGPPFFARGESPAILLGARGTSLGLEAAAEHREPVSHGNAHRDETAGAAERPLGVKTQRRICCSDGRLKPSDTGSRTQGAMRLRREGHDRRRTRDNPAQRSARLAGLLSGVRGAAVCDPPRVENEQLTPVREALGSTS